MGCSVGDKTDPFSCISLFSSTPLNTLGAPASRIRITGSNDENQQQTQHTYDAASGNRTQEISVEGERSRHCATTASCPSPRLTISSLLCYWFCVFFVLFFFLISIFCFFFFFRDVDISTSSSSFIFSRPHFYVFLFFGHLFSLFFFFFLFFKKF